VFTVNGKTIATAQITGTDAQQGWGGIIYVADSSPVFKKVKFRYGQTSNATGVAIFGNSCPVFLHCEFDHSQSAQLGSALGLVYGAPYTSGSPSVVVIGGTFFLNWDAGGVINVERGRSTLVNVSIRDNLEHAIFSGGTDDVFINLTVTGNRGALTDSQYTVKGNATLYNSVIKGNLTTGIAANVDTAATIYNTIATDHPSTIPDGSYLDRGDDDYYPLETNGAWNHGSPGYNNLTYSLGAADGTDLENLTGDAAVLAEAIREALALDSTGTRPRFRGGHIDLGAEEN
jgi:hypothetical protein